MIAIQTKCIRATNTRGTRIKAWTGDFSVTVPFPEGEGVSPYYEAVKALIKKHALDWNTTGMRYGGTEHGYVFCFSDSIVKE